MNTDNLYIDSYRYLGMNYVVKIDGKRYTLSELSDEQLNWLIDINERNRSLEYSDQKLYIFNDVKKIRRKQKLQKICSK